MSSIIEGYSYDVFISYRQNDNKYDGWVTEFIDNLNKELEATIKDKINVYFDANPHDGLLETHLVSRSLEDKLKCLIFIPILSRTYCDEKSFAWNNEFVAFIKIAEQDRFGLNIKLSNGNFESRILPVRIHDLDPEDIKLVESKLGFIRSVDFIYHYQGVNRPLRQRDDDVIPNAKQFIYRDQINKVANAIHEIIRGLKRTQTASIEEKINAKQLKDVQKDNNIIPEIKSSKRVIFPLMRLSSWFIASIILLVIVIFGIKWYNKQEKIKWAQLVQVPAIQQMVDENFTAPTKAFEMATELEKIIPWDSSLIKLLPRISTTFVMNTNPAEADLFWKDYNIPDDDWKYVGTTPLQNARFPKGYLRLKIEKQGFQTIEYAGPDNYLLGEDISQLRLDSVGKLPDNMVRIPSKTTSMIIVGLEQYGGKRVGEFLVDKYEVTNKEYKQFVDSGGYLNKKYWNNPIFANGKEQPWFEAVKLFIDKTGKFGPSTWEVGTYPDGKENHPVSGVSWYEAAAYAEFVHKKLPSVYQWSVIAQTGRTKDIVPLSNFNEISTLPVGSSPGITSYGIYDIAGNVREWCRNEGNQPDQRYILGGGFNDPIYSFNCAYTQLSVDRSVSNGFRCIKELPGDSSVSKLSGSLDLAFRDYKKEKPVDDKTFNIYRRQFDYDKSPLNPKILTIEESTIWKVEKVTLDASYGNEQFNVWLFLPKNSSPPYQPVIFYHGSGIIFSDVFESSVVKGLEFIVKSGRALVFPILKGTFERRDGLNSDLADKTVFYKDHVIMWRKDIGRTIDYLETRKDLFSDKIGYFGYSWGGFMGGIIPAVETRIKSVVLLVGGMQMNRSLPEVDQINFLPRVFQPILMLNGKYDMFFPEETSQKPMYELLGSKTKELKIYNEGHLVPRQDLIKETLKWYDQYLGEIKN
jgi:dienelactone hydrolase